MKKNIFQKPSSQNIICAMSLEEGKLWANSAKQTLILFQVYWTKALNEAQCFYPTNGKKSPGGFVCQLLRGLLQSAFLIANINNEPKFPIICNTFR